MSSDGRVSFPCISQNQPINNTWTASFYGYDGGGSVRNLTDSNGAVTDTYEYDAFGNSFTVSGTTPNNYLYRGEQYDPDLGLYYLRARYYKPLGGRFTSRDPENGKAADPKTLHKYLYAGGDPVNASDPNGREFTNYAALVTNSAKITWKYGHTFGPCVNSAFLDISSDLDAERYNTIVLYPGQQIAAMLAKCNAEAAKKALGGFFNQFPTF